MSTAARTDRLRPVRAGLVNLWDYSDDEFRFVDGRLVLRGPNGSGKTKALELLFPFLLDANLAPQRLDPFSGTGRTMRDNLLFRPDRETVIGYAWMEFETSQVEDDGGDVVVIGAGLRANRSDQRVTSWYFVTDRRYGDGWAAIDGERRPLTRRQLAEELGPRSVFETASDYRRAVDTRLFGLGVDRYEALVQLVLFLRRPQLAKDLDLRRLSETLSMGLRPLDEDLLAEGARSFDDLEAVQRELERLDRACSAAEGFMRAYRPYVRAVARGRADGVLEARRASKAALRARAGAEELRNEAAAARTDAHDRRTSVRSTLERLTAEKDALQRSEAYRAVGQTEDLRARVADAEAELERAIAARGDAALRLDEASSESERLDTDMVACAARVDRAEAAMRAGAETVAGSRLDDIDSLLVGPSSNLGPGLRLVIDERSADLGAVEEACRLWESARADLTRADEQLEAARGRLDSAIEALEQAERSEALERDTIVEAIVEWSRGFAGIVEAADAEHLTAMVDGGLPDIAGEAQRLLDPRRRRIDIEATETVAHLKALADQRDGVTVERDLVASAHDDEPPAPATRGADRTQAQGAPLWRLVDFVEGLDDEAKAGIEASLEAAGLLDAWINPDGSRSDDVDVYLRSLGPGGESTLAEVLVPDASTDEVPPEVVRSLLDSTAFGPSDWALASIAIDGRFSIGPLAGTASKPAAEYIGASTREARRRARVAQLDTRIAELGAVIAETQLHLDNLRDKSRRHDEALEAVPSTDPLAAAVRAVDLASVTVVNRRDDEGRADEHREGCARASTEHHDRLAREAGRREVPADRAGIDSFASSLRGFESAVSVFVGQIRESEALSAQADKARVVLDERSATHKRSIDEVGEREGALSTRRHELATIEDSMGIAAAEVLASLSTVDGEIVAAKAEEVTADNDLTTAQASLHEADLAAERATIAHGRAAEDEDEALDGLRVLARPELRSVVVVELPDPTEPSDPNEDSWLTRFADLLDAATQGVVGTAEQRSRSKSQVLNSFQQLERDLGAAYHTSLDEDDDIALVWISDDDGERSAAAFTERIAGRRDEHQHLLSAQERQVLEDTLLDGLCRQLHERTVDAREQVAAMNRALADRSTTSGKRVRLSWVISPDLGPERRMATRLLESDPALLGAGDREQVREHLATEIRTERAMSPAASYQEVLSTVLDYRSWRNFDIKVTEDGEEHALTKARYNKYSGGERATVLHLPLFAAAAAHYSSGFEGGPRLVALDEAFAGIDDRTTADLMALAVEFDLDLFLTGHDLRATYADVPGVSIVHLTHHREAHAVSTLHMRWDGEILHHEP